MENKTAHYQTPIEKIELSEYDMLTIQAFLRENKIEFYQHCRTLDIGITDAIRIIMGLHE